MMHAIRFSLCDDSTPALCLAICLEEVQRWRRRHPGLALCERRTMSSCSIKKTKGHAKLRMPRLLVLAWSTR